MDLKWSPVNLRELREVCFHFVLVGRDDVWGSLLPPWAAFPSSLLKWPQGGFSSDICHERLLFSTASANTQLLENAHKQKRVTPLFLVTSSCSQMDLVLSLSRWSELSGGPRELCWLLPSKGQQWQLTLAPLHLSHQQLWADYVDKGQREHLTWSQPSSGLENSRLGLNYAIESIFVPFLDGCTCNNRLNRNHCITFPVYCLLGNPFFYTVGILVSWPHF